jgi:PBP1b-binding outer membrane lipoprotein LpoB
MKKYQTLIVYLGILFISGCAAVPRQVVDAMEMQQQELERIKAIYFVNMNNHVKERLDGIFKDSSIAVAESTSKEEMAELISEIKLGTATNNTIARFLELASQLGIA